MSKFLVLFFALFSISVAALPIFPPVGTPGPKPTVPPETRVGEIPNPGQPIPVPPWEERLPK